MNIKFNLINSLKKSREQYVRDYRVGGELKIEPCEKFVACVEKLSKNQVLALRDNASIETLQIANQNDIEFFEGYELTPWYTNDLRKQLCYKSAHVYQLILHIIEMFGSLENSTDDGNKTILNDIKLDFDVIKQIIKNIYEHLTMTNNEPIFRNEIDGQKLNLQYLYQSIVNLIDELIDIDSKLIIDYISRQIKLIIEKIFNHLNKLNRLSTK